MRFLNVRGAIKAYAHNVRRDIFSTGVTDLALNVHLGSTRTRLVNVLCAINDTVRSASKTGYVKRVTGNSSRIMPENARTALSPYRTATLVREV